VSVLHSSHISSGTGFQVSGQPSIPMPCGIAAASACTALLPIACLLLSAYCESGR
jgi:hypothetical protein